MCVAVTLSKNGKVPTEAQIELMFEANPDGAGLAWIAKGSVVWTKGLQSTAKIAQLVRDIPKPALLHFRLTSAGGTHPSLTHPFPIEARPRLALSDSARSVLIHNGHWGAYLDVLAALKVVGEKKVMKGRVSDTRLMAHLAATSTGPTILRHLAAKGQKIATLDRHGFVTRYGKWTEVDGFFVSNQFWQVRKFVKNAQTVIPSKSVCDPYGLTSGYSLPISYAEWEDSYVPSSLHRMTEQELIAELGT